MLKKELEKQLHEFVIQVYKEGFEDAEMETKARVEVAYEKGLEDAWKCMKKILLSTDKGGIDVEDLFKIFDMHSAYNILETVSVDEAIQKIKEYEGQQKQDEKCENCAKEISAKCVVDGCEFEPKQTDATDMNDGSIKVGDEVRMKGSDPVRDDCDYGICTWSLPNINTIYVMHRDGSSGQANKDEWYRTGRHFPQVAEVLEQLRGEE